MVAIRQVFVFFFPEPTFASAVLKEALIWLVIFSLGHWSGGAANILIAFAAGLILTGFYLWRRDLVANMIGHGLVDFVANVLPKLFS
jgi:membrane protease YdiL (CAAX protease family)